MILLVFVFVFKSLLCCAQIEVSAMFHKSKGTSPENVPITFTSSLSRYITSMHVSNIDLFIIF